MQGKNIGENLTQHPYYLPNISKSVFTGTKKSDPKEYILYWKKKNFFFRRNHKWPWQRKPFNPYNISTSEQKVINLFTFPLLINPNSFLNEGPPEFPLAAITPQDTHTHCLKGVDKFVSGIPCHKRATHIWLQLLCILLSTFKIYNASDTHSYTQIVTLHVKKHSFSWGTQKRSPSL